jgi:hypothetical protein
MLYRKKKDARAGKGDVALWHNVAALRPSATRVGGNELAEHVYLITAGKAPPLDIACKLKTDFSLEHAAKTLPLDIAAIKTSPPQVMAQRHAVSIVGQRTAPLETGKASRG